MPLLILVLGAAVLAACTPVSVATLPITETSTQPAQLTASPTLTISVVESTNNTIYIAYLRLEAPSSGSEVVSPLHLSALLPATAGILRIELFGEGGRLIARQVLRAQGASQLELDLAFEPLKSIETARLAISIDDEFGRLHELISVEITLLAEGQSKLVAGEEQSLLVIESPQTGDTFSGGTVTVNGILRASAGLLNIQLISREGRVLKSVDLRSAGGEEETFSTELVYNLPASEWVQVAVSLREDGIVTAFKSAEVWLVP